jgi:hypothetical protein
VAFQAGELLLSGAVQVADASAQELARSGDPAAALAAGAAQTRQVLATAGAPVLSAVNTAVTNIRNSLHDPFPSTAKTTAPSVTSTLTAKADVPKTLAKKSESLSSKKASDRKTHPAMHERKVDHPKRRPGGKAG